MCLVMFGKVMPRVVPEISVKHFFWIHYGLTQIFTCFFHGLVLPLSMKIPWKPKRQEKLLTFYVREPDFQPTHSFPLPIQRPATRSPICASKPSHLVEIDISTPILELPTTSNEAITHIFNELSLPHLFTGKVSIYFFLDSIIFWVSSSSSIE